MDELDQVMDNIESDLRALHRLRRKINAYDSAIIGLIAARVVCVKEIADLKVKSGLGLVDVTREKAVRENMTLALKQHEVPGAEEVTDLLMQVLVRRGQRET